MKSSFKSRAGYNGVCTVFNKEYKDFKMCTLLMTSQQKSIKLQILIYLIGNLLLISIFFKKKLTISLCFFLSVLILFKENKLSFSDFSTTLNNFLLDDLYAVCY